MGIYRNVWLKYEKIWIFPTSEKKGGLQKKKERGALFFEEDRMKPDLDK